MKLFECQNCRQPLYFENTRCESCGLNLGYLPEREVVTALKPDDGLWHALAEPTTRYRYCANAEHAVTIFLRFRISSPFACRPDIMARGHGGRD